MGEEGRVQGRGKVEGRKVKRRRGRGMERCMGGGMERSVHKGRVVKGGKERKTEEKWKLMEKYGRTGERDREEKKWMCGRKRKSDGEKKM